MSRTGKTGEREVVLVADDNPAKRYLVTRWLEQAGFAVVEAADGAGALRLAQEQPSLVILDVKLPDLSGFEVCRRLKGQPHTAHLPVLHLSGRATSADDRIEGLDSGADGYLTYPVEPEELRATVRALLRVRRAEAALRASEERYRLVARATNDVVRDWDLATDTVEWGAAVRAVLGHDDPDARRASGWWAAHVHPDDRQRVTHGLRAVVDAGGDHWSDEYRFRRGDGGWAMVLDRCYVLHDDRGAPVRVIGSMLDVTERRRTEEAQHLLADAGAVLAGALDGDAALRSIARLVVPRLAEWCVIWVCTPEGAAAGPPVGPLEPRAVAAADEAAEAALHGLGSALRSESAPPAGWVLRALQTGAPQQLDALPALVPSSVPLPPARSALALPLLARGRTLGVMLLVNGPDAPTYTPADLALAADLAVRTALAVDNARLYDAALAANRVKADFLAMMSHELRTPLNAVVGYSDLLMLGIPQQLAQGSQEYVTRVQTCARHLLSLIEQILTFSRVEAGREAVLRETVDVGELVQETTALVEPLLQLKGLRYTRECDGAIPALESDPGKLRQILLNLLSNAAKFTERGEVRVRATVGDGALVVAVRDTGPGIPREHLEHIFDPFWQVEQRRTHRVGGTGLGLTVSRQLAQLLGGTLTVESAPGAGSTFTLRLPVHAPVRLDAAPAARDARRLASA